MAVLLGALAGGLVAFVASLAHRARARRLNPGMDRVRFEVIGSVLGALAGGVAGAFLPLPAATAIGAASPLVIPPVVLLFGLPFRSRKR